MIMMGEKVGNKLFALVWLDRVSPERLMGQSRSGLAKGSFPGSCALTGSILDNYPGLEYDGKSPWHWNYKAGNRLREIGLSGQSKGRLSVEVPEYGRR